MQGNPQWYYQIAQTDYPELITTHQETVNREQLIAEICYFYMHDEMPAWGQELERVEVFPQPDGTRSHLFIQRDPSTAN